MPCQGQATWRSIGCEVRCPAGELMLEDGSCTPAGIGFDGCSEGFAWDGDRLCEPILPPEECPPGMVAWPGDSACHEVSPCGAGAWGDVQGDLYVDAGFGGMSTGTMAAPFATIGDALAQASNGDTIAIAAGTYNEDVFVTRSVTLQGKCTAEVTISGQTEVETILFRNGASDAALRDLSITGPSIGIIVSGAERVVIDRVRVHDTGWRGIDVENVLGPAGAIVSRSLVESVGETGVYVLGGSLDVSETEVRAVRATQGARGVNAQLDLGLDLGSTLTLSRVYVHDVDETGLRALGSSVQADAVVIRDVQPVGSEYWLGRGLGPEPIAQRTGQPDADRFAGSSARSPSASRCTARTRSSSAR